MKVKPKVPKVPKAPVAPPVAEIVPSREDLIAEAMKDLRTQLEDNLISLHRGRDRNQAWWREVSPATAILFK